MSKKGLGRGLSALIPELPQQDINPNSIQDIPISRIRPNPKQPRKNFSQESLQELAESIKIHGIIQPIVVRSIEGGYELVAGERRLRASKIAGLDTIKAVIQNFTDRQLAEIALIENLQREDLNSIEEAEAYQKLIDEFHLTQEQLSLRLGKSRSAIANTLRLLDLAKDVKELVIKGLLKPGQVRPLLVLDKSKQKEVANLIVEKSLNTRQIEKYVKELREKEKILKLKKEENIDPEIKDVEEKIMESIGVKVKIKGNDKKGVIEINYYDENDLNRIIQLLLDKG
ncbi:ParB/RepB/Spo0J family partition protein [Anaerobranca gottschalkii]|uniref:Chromosome partitioning protein, ParB family n=1 Tax=Anaerobranca gottschalkii DSM 13577 TaxID=1120990 RepID=A0A1I0B3S4_9FIRM|nr:ParB/RepB/Spo0J family partition protein [Anaerobranca gottschalkii]SET01136.1 chromosome partitioning protein, ParB family [Anaerobranca gottschalkii DSM 13577]